MASKYLWLKCPFPQELQSQSLYCFYLRPLGCSEEDVKECHHKPPCYSRSQAIISPQAGTDDDLIRVILPFSSSSTLPTLENSPIKDIIMKHLPEEYYAFHNQLHVVSVEEATPLEFRRCVSFKVFTRLSGVGFLRLELRDVGDVFVYNSLSRIDHPSPSLTLSLVWTEAPIASCVSSLFVVMRVFLTRAERLAVAPSGLTSPSKVLNTPNPLTRNTALKLTHSHAAPGVTVSVLGEGDCELLWVAPMVHVAQSHTDTHLRDAWREAGERAGFKGDIYAYWSSVHGIALPLVATRSHTHSAEYADEEGVSALDDMRGAQVCCVAAEDSEDVVPVCCVTTTQLTVVRGNLQYGLAWKRLVGEEGMEGVEGGVCERVWGWVFGRVQSVLSEDQVSTLHYTHTHTNNTDTSKGNSKSKTKAHSSETNQLTVTQSPLFASPIPSQSPLTHSATPIPDVFGFNEPLYTLFGQPAPSFSSALSMTEERVKRKLTHTPMHFKKPRLTVPPPRHRDQTHGDTAVCEREMVPSAADRVLDRIHDSHDSHTHPHTQDTHREQRSFADLDSRKTQDDAVQRAFGFIFSGGDGFDDGYGGGGLDSDRGHSDDENSNVNATGNTFEALFVAASAMPKKTVMPRVPATRPETNSNFTSHNQSLASFKPLVPSHGATTHTPSLINMQLKSAFQLYCRVNRMKLTNAMVRFSIERLQRLAITPSPTHSADIASATDLPSTLTRSMQLYPDSDISPRDVSLKLVQMWGKEAPETRDTYQLLAENDVSLAQ